MTLMKEIDKIKSCRIPIHFTVETVTSSTVMEIGSPATFTISVKFGIQRSFVKVVCYYRTTGFLWRLKFVPLLQFIKTQSRSVWFN